MAYFKPTMGSGFEDHELWTSSMAIAQFVHAQRPKGTTPSCKGSRLLQSGDGMLSAECTPRNGGAHGVGNYRTLGRDVTEMLPCNGDLQKVHNAAALSCRASEPPKYSRQMLA